MWGIVLGIMPICWVQYNQALVMPGTAPGGNGMLETVHIRVGGDDRSAVDGEHAGSADSGQAVHADARIQVDVEDLALAA